MRTKQLIFLFHLLLIACIYRAGITTATAQTLEVLPVNAFFSGSQVQSFFKRADGSYFFFATDGSNGLQLWKTDGTTAGTAQLQAPAPYTAGLPGTPSPTYTAGKDWLLVNNELYFVVDSRYLFCSNGNTLLLLATAANTISELTASGNIIYFRRVEGSGTSVVAELWKTDGTVAGTMQLKAFGGGGSGNRATVNVSNITNVNGTVFFRAAVANDGLGYALYKSDGTAAGTVLVKDVNPADTASLVISDLYAAGRYLYFKGNSSGTQSAGKEWWISNGTPAGTYQLTHFGNFNNSAISPPIAYGDTLYVATPYGADTYARQIWKLTPNPSNPDSIFYEAQVNTVSLLQLIDGKIYFLDDLATAAATKRLYASNGSRTDTVLLQVGALPQTPDPDRTTTFYPMNGYNYYFVRQGASAYNLCRTDGTAAGTTVVTTATKAASLFIKVGDAFYFRAVDASVSGNTAYNIWKSDGTAAGTKKIAGRIFPNQVAAAGTDGTYYYFTSTDSVWATNGDTVINMPLGTASTMTGLRPSGIYPTATKLVVAAKLATGSSNANLDLFTGDHAFSIQPQPQTIGFTDVTKTYGDVDAALGATATSGLDITYSIADPTIATITNGTLHILKSGATTITASQPGNGTSWLPATDVTVTLTVNKVALTITADDKTKTEGDPNPVLTFTCNGLVNGETAIVLTTQPVLATTATQASAAGTYPITVSGAMADNYTITYVDGTLTINPAVKQPQAITFAGLTSTYGDADFAPGATASSGLQVTYTSDNPAVATVVGNNIHIVGAGTANITASQPGNGFWFPAADVTVSLTVNKAALIITADDKSRFQDDPNPPLTVAYAGFVNGETVTSLTTPPVVTTTAMLSSPPGAYPLTVSGATAGNYVISYTEGTLTVKALPVTADRVDAVFNGNTLQVRVYSSKAQRAVLQLADVTGRVLLTQDISLVSGLNNYQLPVFNIAAGAYIVLVRGEGLKLSDKIIR